MEAQRKAVETVPVDESAIRATTQELVEAQTELAIERAKLHAQVFALLTPEQQAQAAKLRAEREARRSQMRERVQQRQPRQQG
jgi:protein CpxP